MKILCTIIEIIIEALKTCLDYVALYYQGTCNPGSARYKKLEARVPRYTLPDPLLMLDATPVNDAVIWNERRRPEILNLFQTHVYGCSPELQGKPPITVISVDGCAFRSAATRKEIRIGLAAHVDAPAMTLLIYLPNTLKMKGIKAPLFLGLNFFGNHTIHNDPSISVTTNWIPNNSITQGRPPDMLRGIQSSAWPIEFILKHGYGVATAYCGDIVPDRSDGLEFGIHKWFRQKELHRQTVDSWGAIGCWAWGLSRAMDYLEGDPDIDGNKIAVIGHSRLGKTALWAGAQDQRFAMVISNNSGRGGAALSRRNIGETLANMNSSFPHWFCDNFKGYGERVDTLPVDQHELLSLIAPRPVYVASAHLDLHADPMGEFLAAQHASPVYRLLGANGLPADELPALNVPSLGTIGYHIRRGRHGITRYDWVQFIRFVDIHLGSHQWAD